MGVLESFESSDRIVMHYQTAIRGALSMLRRELSDRFFCVNSGSRHLRSVSLGAMRGGREGVVASKTIAEYINV